MDFYRITDEQVRQFEEDGYLMVRGLLTSEEVELLQKIAHGDGELARIAKDRHDLQGAVTRLALRNDLPDDIYGAIARCRRMVDTMERLLGGEPDLPEDGTEGGDETKQVADTCEIRSTPAED